jgi:hypothetical protein
VTMNMAGRYDRGISSVISAVRAQGLTQFGEKRLRLLQILGVEAFGEPAVNRGEQLICLLAFALALPSPC